MVRNLVIILYHCIDFSRETTDLTPESSSIEFSTELPTSGVPESPVSTGSGGISATVVGLSSSSAVLVVIIIITIVGVIGCSIMIKKMRYM